MSVPSVSVTAVRRSVPATGAEREFAMGVWNSTEAVAGPRVLRAAAFTAADPASVSCTESPLDSEKATLGRGEPSERFSCIAPLVKVDWPDFRPLVAPADPSPVPTFRAPTLGITTVANTDAWPGPKAPKERAAAKVESVICLSRL